MRWLSLVLCLLWLGWRVQSLWQRGLERRRRRRLDPLSTAFLQELRRHGLIVELRRAVALSRLLRPACLGIPA